MLEGRIPAAGALLVPSISFGNAAGELGQRSRTKIGGAHSNAPVQLPQVIAERPLKSARRAWVHRDWHGCRALFRLRPSASYRFQEGLSGTNPLECDPADGLQLTSLASKLPRKRQKRLPRCCRLPPRTALSRRGKVPERLAYFLRTGRRGLDPEDIAEPFWRGYPPSQSDPYRQGQQIAGIRLGL